MYRNLEAELSRQKITREILSKEMGISISTLSTKITGKVKFTLEEAINIKKILALDESLEFLFARDQDTA